VGHSVQVNGLTLQQLCSW